MAVRSSHLYILAIIGAACSNYLWAPDEKSPASDQTHVNIEPRSKPSGKAEVALPKANIRVDATVVLIPVTVTDPLNRFVTGLEKENFRISEDKVEQKIQQIFERRRAAQRGVSFRHQRQHGKQNGQVSPGSGRVSQDHESRG